MHDENDFARTRANMAADVELLPCPFCGSTDALRLQNTHTASFWVSCSEDDGGCGAKASGQFFPGPSRRTRFCYDPEAPEGSTFYARTLGELHPEYRRAAKSAIAAWNRRANVAHATAPLQAEIKALRAEVDAVVKAAQAPRACTCHPDDRPDGPCRERYAASECQALAAQAQAANADALDAARYRWLRDREIPEWLDLWHQNPDRIDDAIDQARGEGEP